LPSCTAAQRPRPLLLLLLLLLGADATLLQLDGVLLLGLELAVELLLLLLLLLLTPGAALSVVLLLLAAAAVVVEVVVAASLGRKAAWMRVATTPWSSRAAGCSSSTSGCGCW
jgi:hypothetical protein